MQWGRRWRHLFDRDRLRGDALGLFQGDGLLRCSLLLYRGEKASMRTSLTALGVMATRGYVPPRQL